MKCVRIRIPLALAPHVMRALDDAASNGRALALSYEEAADMSKESWFLSAASAERKLALRLDRISARIAAQLLY